jgi:hypothetical protein
MKLNVFVLQVFLFNTSLVLAQFPVHVKKIECIPNQTVSVKGNLSQGAHMEDLSWAWRSSVACFPSTQKLKFTGNHVLYSTVIPPRAIMNITVTPDDKNDNFSLYAYQIGTTNYSTVPELNTCLACEADHKWDYDKVGKTQDHRRVVSLNTIDDDYNVVIGVVGANGLDKGAYTLSIEVQGGEQEVVKEQEAIKVIPVETAKNKISTVKGDLKDGVIIQDLSWAWTSSNACFPETQKLKFTGNHVLYSAVLPDNSNMEVTVIPDDKNADFSLYAYQVGLSNNSLVPNLPSCVTCESDQKWDRPKVGKKQDHTRMVGNLTSMEGSYKIIIGVVGSNGLKAGSYTLKISVKDRE